MAGLEGVLDEAWGNLRYSILAVLRSLVLPFITLTGWLCPNGDGEARNKLTVKVVSRIRIFRPL